MPGPSDHKSALNGQKGPWNGSSMKKVYAPEIPLSMDTSEKALIEISHMKKPTDNLQNELCASEDSDRFLKEAPLCPAAGTGFPQPGSRLFKYGLLPEKIPAAKQESGNYHNQEESPAHQHECFGKFLSFSGIFPDINPVVDH